MEAQQTAAASLKAVRRCPAKPSEALVFCPWRASKARKSTSFARFSTTHSVQDRQQAPAPLVAFLPSASRLPHHAMATTMGTTAGTTTGLGATSAGIGAGTYGERGRSCSSGDATSAGAKSHGLPTTSVRRPPTAGKVILTVKSAHNMLDKAWLGKSDPYCVIRLADAEIQTHHVKNAGEQCVWDESVGGAALPARPPALPPACQPWPTCLDPCLPATGLTAHVHTRAATSKQGHAWQAG